MQAWTQHAAEHGQAADGGAAAVTLLVVPPATAPEPLALLPPATVQARTDTPAPALHAFLARHAAAAAAALEAAHETQRGLADTTRHVERQLRLRSLARGAAVTDAEFREGCARLLRHHAALREALEGCRVRVNDVNEAVPGRDVVDIAWDFEM